MIDVVVGGGIGAVVGAVIAVNFVIIIGTEDGYESSIGDVFAYNAVAGVVTVALLVGFPLVGVWLARRRRI